MNKQIYSFDIFFSQVEENYKDFAKKVHEKLTQQGYKIRIDLNSTGYFDSYAHPKIKRCILNLLFRKIGLKIRIYADNHSKYSEFINTIPYKMVKEIEKKSICKRLINPESFNPKCVIGYDFLFII